MLGFVTPMFISQFLLKGCAVAAAWSIAGMIVHLVNRDLEKVFYWMRALIICFMASFVSMCIIAFTGLPLP